MPAQGFTQDGQLFSENFQKQSGACRGEASIQIIGLEGILRWESRDFVSELFQILFQVLFQRLCQLW